ncbi:MW1434 family type I TA system toxin [Xenorhabdus sp. PB30.3]|uniref:Thoeris anti-defense Tad2 family protein n=1 Tax=Xenorhabdus sp. PB30.3 TaxID=2788941 RepID=UPI001E452CD6|nr:MW1434 family type I TA system toxin [Xenorhabdus sp. PB30.3]MCC8378650.1 DUF2829 domain-containing protein [Xenorhabdus sp. PB30.3]
MSDVNKLDDKNCSFDPEKYKVTYKTTTTVELSNDVTAPVGSFAWAIIQLNLGKLVKRKDWDSPKQYLRFNKESGYIEEYDKHDHWERWSPKQEDMVACDWLLEAMCPEDAMLIFDLKLGFEQIPAGNKWWGYNNWGSKSIHTGTLNIIQNKIGIIDIQWFYLDVDNTIPTLLTIALQVSTDKNSDQKVYQIFKKNFYVTVDNETYNLGIRPSWGQNGLYTRNVSYTYDSRYDAHNLQKLNVKKLSEILKQTDQTKRFCITWRDK